MANDNLNPTRLIRQARAQIDAYLEHDDPCHVRPERIEAALMVLGRLSHVVGGRAWRQYKAQFERYCEHDLNAKPERADAVITLLERAVRQLEYRRLMFA